MKRFAAMCLIASMIASMGSVTGYAAEADGAGQTAVYQTAGSASDETEVLGHPMKRLTVLRPVSWHEAAAT